MFSTDSNFVKVKQWQRLEKMMARKKQFLSAQNQN
jgi:hypothetical protein